MLGPARGSGRFPRGALLRAVLCRRDLIFPQAKLEHELEAKHPKLRPGCAGWLRCDYDLKPKKADGNAGAEALRHRPGQGVGGRRSHATAVSGAPWRVAVDRGHRVETACPPSFSLELQALAASQRSKAVVVKGRSSSQ